METTTKRSLFDIGEEMLELERYLESLDGDVSEPGVDEKVMAWFKNLGDAQATKIDNYIALMRKWEGEAAAAKAEIDRYKKSVQVRENRVERFKEKLKEHMEATHQKKIETATGRTVAIQNKGGKVPMFVDDVDPTTVPAAYQKIAIEIDNEAVRKDLESGKALAFAELGERGTQLRIR
jgi:hypothetical protein